MINVGAEYMIDAYKIGHRDQYPDGTTFIMSNFTPRKSRIPSIDRVIFFGTSYFIQEYLVNHWDDLFFNRGMSKERALSYKDNINEIIGPNRVTAEHIYQLHRLRYLPIRIKALPEGSIVPFGVPPIVIHATLPQFSWLVNYLETILSCIMWMPSTSATNAFFVKRELYRHVKKVGGSYEFVDYQMHDFSMRGMPGLEAACMSGAAHLSLAKGTDTIPALFFVQQYYDPENSLSISQIGGSVTATEHSVMCMNAEYITHTRHFADGRTWEEVVPNEFKSFQRLIRKYPFWLISIVSDSFNLWTVLEDYLVRLKDEIMQRHHYVVLDTGFEGFIEGDLLLPEVDLETGELLRYFVPRLEATIDPAILNNPLFRTQRVEGKVVIRPDSGDLVKILTGYFAEELIYHKTGEVFFLDGGNKRPVNPTEQIGVIESLWKTFGGTFTEFGFKTLDQHIGVIYGDGITNERLREILSRCEEKEFYFTGVLGLGSFFYQYVTRDTFGWAMKATYGEVTVSEGVDDAGNVIEFVDKREIYKKPITDDGTKNSARGITAVFKNEQGDYYLKDRATMEEFENCELATVYENSRVNVYGDMRIIRKLINDNLLSYIEKNG